MGEQGKRGPLPRRSLDRRWLACVLCLAVVALSAVTGVLQHRANLQNQKYRFQQITDDATDTLEAQLPGFEAGLRGARGAIIAAGPQLDRERFRAYSASRDQEKEFPGVRGYGYIQRVPKQEEATFLQAARADGVPDFALRSLAPNTGDRFVIRYLEPPTHNEAAIGLDIASEPARRGAALAAARTGQATLTPPITLVQEAGLTRQGFLLLLPVYATGAPLQTAEERWAATQGWAFATLTIDAVLNQLDDLDRPYAMALSDASEAHSTPFYANTDFASLHDAQLRVHRRIRIHGRTWRLEFVARPTFLEGLWQPSPWWAALITAGLGFLSVSVWYLVITARERRRAAFLNHAQLAALVTNSTEIIIACDPAGRITLWNAAAENSLGYPATDAIGRNMGLLLIDERGQPAFADLSADLQGAPHRLLRKDGSLADVLASLSVIRDAAGHLQGASLFLHDISHLLRAEEQFRRVVEASPSAILMVDEAGQIKLANAKAEELFGYARADLLGKSMEKLLPAAIRPPHGSYIQNYFNDPRARPMGAGRDLYGLRHDGTQVPIEIGLNPIQTAEGRFALAFIIDITERKRHEEGILRLNATLEQQVLERTAQIRTYSSRLGAILEHAGYAIIVTDPQGHITLFNPAAERMLGYVGSKVAASGMSIDVLHDEAELLARSHALSQRDGVPVGANFAQIAALATTPGSDKAEWTYVCQDGTRLPVTLNVSALRDEQGNASGFLVMASDLTEQKRHDSELHQAINAAEHANRSKSDFLANMSHEIRTPMNGILGMLYLLDGVELPTAAQDMVRKINLAARSLLNIINDVLDFSKVEAGRIELEEAPFDLAQVLDNVASLMTSAVDSSKVEMLVSSTPEGARHLRGDSLRLSQVLVNLVSNAIKFTRSGEIALRVDRLPSDDPTRALLRFSVSDTGIGIPAEKQAMIFSPFSQVDSSTTRRFGGTGLGLSICNRLVALMGGTLSVDSTPDRGSTFRFDLEFPLVGISSEEVAPYRSSCHVLVVDDDDSAREHHGLVIRGFGWTAEEIESGEQAVERVAASDAAPCDVVLMDWKMPGMDGLSAAADIRQRLQGSQQPIIIMVTAFERKLVDQEAHRDAVDAILTKPVTASALYNSITEVLAHRAPALHTHSSKGPSGQRLAGLRLLVVDDSEINREVAQRILEGEGASVVQAGDGSEALNLLRAGIDRFDAVLMDVQMPVMDGYEATRRIRALPELTDLPVIALTAGAFRPQQDAAIASGMNAFVPKPFEVPALIAAIVRCTSGQASPAFSPQVISPEHEAPAAVTDGNALQLLDIPKGLMYWRDAVPYRRYLAQFARRYAGMVDALEELLARQDTVQAGADVHRMRGAAASLAMPKLVAVSAAVEERLRAGDAVGELLPRLRVTLQETIHCVTRYVPPENPPQAPSQVSSANPAAALSGLLDALNSDDPDVIEQVLARMQDALPDDARRQLAMHIEEFDYRAAEAQTRTLLQGLRQQAAHPHKAPVKE